MNRFLLPEIPAPGGTAELSPEESHHLTKVLRMQVGETVAIIDGKGTIAEAKIAEISSKRATVEVSALHRAESPRSAAHLVFAIPKGQAFDFIVHRATEIGVSSLQPLETQHSLSMKSWNEDRWKKVVAEVGKQCQELFFPEVRAPLSLNRWLTERKGRPLVFCDEAERDPSFGALEAKDGIDILVGAEGGWSQEESTLIRSHGAKLLGLGRNRLRAETAAIVSLVIVKRALGEI